VLVKVLMDIQMAVVAGEYPFDSQSKPCAGWQQTRLHLFDEIGVHELLAVLHHALEDVFGVGRIDEAVPDLDRVQKDLKSLCEMRCSGVAGSQTDGIDRILRQKHKTSKRRLEVRRNHLVNEFPE